MFFLPRERVRVISPPTGLAWCAFSSLLNSDFFAHLAQIKARIQSQCERQTKFGGFLAARSLSVENSTN